MSTHLKWYKNLKNIQEAYIQSDEPYYTELNYIQVEFKNFIFKLSKTSTTHPSDMQKEKDAHKLFTLLFKNIWKMLSLKPREDILQAVKSSSLIFLIDLVFYSMDISDIVNESDLQTCVLFLFLADLKMIPIFVNMYNFDQQGIQFCINYYLCQKYNTTINIAEILRYIYNNLYVILNGNTEIRSVERLINYHIKNI